MSKTTSDKNEKIFLDNQGTVLKVSDRIMYVTSAASLLDGPRINYGVIRKIEYTPCSWNKKRYQQMISVWKEKGGYLEKHRLVTLTYPTVFKCGVVLQYPTDTKVSGS